MTIWNERQLAVTRNQLSKFKAALAQVSKTKASMTLHPLLLQAEIDGFKSMIEDLESQINSYELRKAIKVVFPRKHYQRQGKRRYGLNAFKAGWETARRAGRRDECPYTSPNAAQMGQRRFWLAGFEAYQRSHPHETGLG